MDLFVIKCETCGAQLKVREMSAIGEVLECPRCRSFVEITPPPGWKPPPPEARQAEAQEPSPSEPVRSKPASTGKSVKKTAPQANTPQPTAKQPAAKHPGEGQKKPAKPARNVHPPKETRPAETAKSKQSDATPPTAKHASSKSNRDQPRAKQPRKKQAVAATGLGSMAAAGLDLEAAAKPAVPQATQPATPFVDSAAAPATKVGGISATKLITLAGGGLALCAVIVAAIYLLGGSSTVAPDKPPIVTPVTEQPPAVSAPRHSVYVALSESWLPADTQMIVSLQWLGLTRNAQFAWLQQKLHPAVGEELEAICKTLTIDQGQISRASWAVTNMAAPTDGDLWMLELEDSVTGLDDLLAAATPLDFELGAYRVHQFRDAEWTQPFVIIDRRRVVTGDESTLRSVATGEATSVASDSLKNLLEHVGVGRDLTVLVDLNAVEQQNVDLPAAWISSWGDVGKAWRELRSGADGVALGLDFGNLLVAQVDFLANEAKAHDVQISVDELLAAADPWMTEELQSLQERLQDGEFNDRVARKISILVERGLDALSTSETGIEQVNDELALVWIRARTDEKLSELASAAISSVPAWEARRLAAARELDQAKLRSMIRSVRGFERVNGTFPQGAAGTTSAPAERRLSWISQLLPYFEPQNIGWKDELNFSRPWNSSPNDAVARRNLQAVINPAIGLERTADGFPVTHYVGVAGFGPNAGSLPVGNENVGVFGFDRKISLLDLGDGASQTLAIAGVSAKLGAWAAGGQPTVRAFTTEPYINGLDGFGSGQADGMFGAMADGSVRFFSTEIDPNVFRQLVVVGGPKPAPPEVAVNPDRDRPPLASDPGVNNNGNPDVVPPPENNSVDVTNVGPPPNAAARRDVRDRLAYPLASAKFNQKPLEDIVAFLGNIGGLKFEFDVERLAAVGTSPQERVTLNLDSTNIGEVLDTAANSLGLDYAINGDTVLITAAGAGPFAITQVTYDLTGLASTDGDKVELEALLRDFVMPSAWDVADGPAAMGMNVDSLVVNHHQAGHAEVAQFLGRLRIARGVPGADVLQSQTWLPVTLDTLFSRSSIARAMPITANFFQPTPLLRVIKNLSQKAQVEILFDAPAMRSIGVETLQPVELKLANVTLEQALQDIAGKLGLAVLALDDRTMQLTTPTRADSVLSTEFLPVGDLLNGERTPESLQAGLLRLLPESPADANAPAIHYDKAAQCFIIRANQSQLFAIEQWLGSLDD